MTVVAVISGGLDSFCATAGTPAAEIAPITFFYGQKGTTEINRAFEVCDRAGMRPLKLVDLVDLRRLWVGTQLTDDTVAVEDAYTPSVVVPLRNAVFLTIAAAYAHTIGAEAVVYGAHAEDGGTEPLYPDCTAEFAVALESALGLGHFGTGISLRSPSRSGLSKTENLRAGHDAYGDIVFRTWSCYTSGTLHCGHCESCRNRQAAFAAAGIKDETGYTHASRTI